MQSCFWMMRIPRNASGYARKGLVSILFSAIMLTISPLLLAMEVDDLVQTKTLANGLDIIVIPDAAVPIVTIELAVKNGAFTETDELNGLSHLYEHMFFKGNAVIPNQEAYLKRMRELGIRFNGTTSTERVNYFFTLPANNLLDGLQFMYDATVSPTFDPDEFEKEKHVVTGELDRAESNPQFWLNQEINKLLWFEHLSRKNVIGERDTILAATIDQMETMKERYYLPNNSVILVAGDVTPNAAFEAVEAIFGEWQPGPNPLVEYPIPPHPPLSANQYVLVEQPVQTATIRFSWHGPSVADNPKATYAADILSYILSQPTSTFYKNLVDSGITLSANMGYFTQRYTGPIYMNAQVSPDNLKAAIRAMLNELPKLTDPDYYTDEQLQSAKTILEVQDIYGREKISSFAHTVSFWWAVAGIDYYRHYVQRLQEITKEDIANFVDNYVIDKPFVAGVLLSPELKEASGMSDEVLRNLVESIQKDLAAQ